LKGRVHAINDIKGGWHCGCQMVYVLMTNAATLSYYVQCIYCSIFTRQFKSILNTVYVNDLFNDFAIITLTKLNTKQVHRALANSLLSSTTAKKTPPAYLIIWPQVLTYAWISFSINCANLTLTVTVKDDTNSISIP
jgi:hypothetical protein